MCHIPWRCSHHSQRLSVSQCHKHTKFHKWSMLTDLYQASFEFLICQKYGDNKHKQTKSESIKTFAFWLLPFDLMVWWLHNTCCLKIFSTFATDTCTQFVTMEKWIHLLDLKIGWKKKSHWIDLMLWTWKLWRVHLYGFLIAI